MIRDQLAEHTVNPKLREKLFMAPEHLSQAVESAFQFESAAQLSSWLAAPAPQHATSLAQTVAPSAQPYSHLEINVAGTSGRYSAPAVWELWLFFSPVTCASTPGRGAAV